MSRIGRLPVAIPAGVEVTVAEGNVVTVKGPKGTLERALPTEMEIKVEDGHVVVSRPNDLKKMKSLHGLTRSLIHNMVVGVSEGYTKELEVNGVGYRAQKQGKKLVLSLGYSHPVEMEDPEGLESTVDGNKIIGTSGMSFVEKPPYFGCPSGKIGLLSSMFTNPDYRRKGIAKELLSRVVNEAREYGCGTIQITASDMGVKLYTDFGFVHNENFMQYKL